MSQAFDESYSNLKRLASTDHNYVMRRDGAYEPEAQMFPVQTQEDASMSRSEMAQSPEVTSLDPMVGATGRPDPSYMAGRAELPLEKQKAMFEREAFQAVGAPLGFTTAVLLTLPDLISLPPLIATGMITAEEGKKFENVLNLLKNMPSAQVGEYLKEKGKELGFSDEQIEAFGEGYLGGELSSIVVNAVPGAKQLVKGAKWLKDSAVNYAAGAPARVAERGTSTTLQSGVDPMAALDEAIVGFGRAREVKLPTAEEPGIIVFHGSGSDFDKFQLSKIGTGEGNQAFGRGLYFTDLEDIAKFYRDAMGVGKEVTYKGRKLKDIDSDAIPQEDQLAVMVGQQDTKEAMQILIEREMTAARKNLAGVNQAISDFETNPGAYPLKIFGMPVDMDQALEVRQFNQKRIDAAKEVEKNIDSISAKPAARIYKAKLKVDPKKLLDYDKPIAAQNSFVRGKIKELVQEVSLDDALNLGFDPFEMGEEAALQAARESLLDSEVLTFLNTWRDIRGVEGAAEELLDKYGIKGIKYKAMQGAGARNVPETGAQNYVIFDENLIDIMKKYGIVGSVAVSSVSATQGDQDQGEAQ